MSVVRAQDALVGRSLGEFVLRERIGQGGFGAVYRAIQPALDREAVVKVLHARHHASNAVTERFLREAKLASKLDHPYAAHIYAFGAEPDGELWIAMELVRGTPLDRLLAIQGSLPLERFVPLLDRICEVVHTAHEQGIVHRDLKPANVMVLARAGRLLPKLLDFGIAKGLGGPNDVARAETLDEASADLSTTAEVTPDGLTQRGVLVGSPQYMAPEQWLDAGAVDARSDAYALAVLAYEALTGKPPFGGKTLTALAAAHAQEPPPPLGARFPAALDKVFERALAKDPAARYSDVLAFAAAFRQASGIVTESPSLPAIEPAVRDAALANAPQPIAEAIAALDRARNAHQARDAVAQLTRTIVRYLGLLALACRSRVDPGGDAPAVADAMRALYRRSLSDAEWLDLARQLTRVWIEKPDAYPIPELVGGFHGAAAVDRELDELAGLRDAPVDVLESAVARLSRVLTGLTFLSDYPLVVTLAGGVAERWMGVRTRTTMQIRGKGLAAGVPALLDEDGVPVLSLAPLIQVAAPTPGAPLDMFLFDGRDRRGAKLVALPSGFEHHDDELWDWFRAQLVGSLDETVSETAEESTPYRGLSAFSRDDGALFFGREKQVDAFVNRLRVQPLLAVVGRSGAGKSSFIQAGVIPALPADWRAITMRPGASPLAALVARLEHAGVAADRNALGDTLRADAAKRGPVLLVVDQLEELFTLCSDADERRTFAEALVAIARSVEDPVRVVCTLRDDFLVRTEQLPALRNRIAQGLQLLTVPAAEDLLRIVIEPARRAGYELEDPELPQEMVREVADQPGALALISFTASKLWELRDRHFKQLTRTAYKSLGGVGGALARHAELTLQEMLPEERALTREAFRHLVTSQNTRAVLRRHELRQLLGNSEHADHVMEKLIGARLLVASENEAADETIEIVHEALLVAWPRLVDWRRDDAEGARFREQLRSAAQQWHDRDRASGLLWRDDALADLTRWRARHTGPLTELEQAFADASLAEAARGRRQRRLLLAGLIAVLVAVVVGLVLFNARLATERAQATDAAQTLHDNLQRQYEDEGRRLVLAGDPLQALAYLAKSAELGEHGRAHDFLVAQAIRATDGELFEVHHTRGLRAATFSHDGKRLVTASTDATAIVWDATTGQQLLALPHTKEVMRASFAPDDATILTASTDGIATLWSATTGQPLHRLAHVSAATCALFSPDGKLVLTTGDDDEIVVWDAATGAERFRVHAGGTTHRACAFSADGSVIAAGDRKGTTRLWSAADGSLLHTLGGDVADIETVSFAPSGLRLVVAGNQRAATEWDGATGRELHRLPHTGAVMWAEFSPDGKQIITASDADHTAIVWNAETGETVRTLGGHTASVRVARFSRDGRYIVTAAEDASAQLWDAATGQRAARWMGHRDAVIAVAFDSTATKIVTAGKDAAAVVWNAKPQEHVVWLVGHTSYVQDASFSPDGTRIISASNDATARIWDARTGAVLHVMKLAAASQHADFSPDGTTVATGSDDGKVTLWDVATGAVRTSWSSTGRIVHVAWSPDGSAIAAATLDGWLRCWNVATGRLRFELRAHDGQAVFSAAWSSSGTELITTGGDRVVRIWDRDGKPLAKFSVERPFNAAFDPSGTRVVSVGGQAAAIWNRRTGAVELELVGHVGLVLFGAWTSDGHTVATAAADGTTRLWDAHTGDELAVFEPANRARVATFSPNGDRLVIGHDDGTMAIHDLPRITTSPAELEQLLRCRVPFEVQGDRLRPRQRDPHCRSH